MASDERPSKRHCGTPAEDEDGPAHVPPVEVRRAAIAAANTPFDALVSTLVSEYETEECNYCGDTERLEQCASCRMFTCEMCAIFAVWMRSCETCGENQCGTCARKHVQDGAWLIRNKRTCRTCTPVNPSQ